MFEWMDSETARLVILAVVFTWFGLLIRSGEKR